LVAALSVLGAPGIVSSVLVAVAEIQKSSLLHGNQ